MPELPEVEVLVRHLTPRLVGRRIAGVEVLRRKAVRPVEVETFREALVGSLIRGVQRRGKFLRFDLGSSRGSGGQVLLGHLGMTGRMYLQPADRAWPRHASVVLGLGEEDWVYEDPRQFGGFDLGEGRLAGLGPEPLGAAFTTEVLRVALGRSRQPIKVRLLDQGLVAGLGNIYVCEALHVAGIAPDRESGSLGDGEVGRLRWAIREVLAEAIELGSRVVLDPSPDGIRDGLFYFGRSRADLEPVVERFRVYDREGDACRRCSAAICRRSMAGRSTYFCLNCQR